MPGERIRSDAIREDVQCDASREDIVMLVERIYSDARGEDIEKSHIHC